MKYVNIITSANSQWTKTHGTVKYQQDRYICKHEDIFPSLSHTHTHSHAGDCRGGEKQAYLLQGGKEWRRKVKKEKKKKNQELYYRAKRKVETESKEWFFFFVGDALCSTEGCVECEAMCVWKQALQSKKWLSELLCCFLGGSGGVQDIKWRKSKFKCAAQVVPCWPRRLHPTWWAAGLWWSRWFQRSSFQR